MIKYTRKLEAIQLKFVVFAHSNRTLIRSHFMVDKMKVMLHIVSYLLSGTLVTYNNRLNIHIICKGQDMSYTII